jgi:hypothetical protein
MFITNMSIQVITKLVLIIPLAYKNTSSVMYKIVLVGTVYTLYKITNLSKELFAKISEKSSTKN